MSDGKTTKTKLYTFDEMRDVVVQTIVGMSQTSAHDSRYNDPTLICEMEMAVGSRLLAKLDEKHEKGEL